MLLLILKVTCTSAALSFLGLPLFFNLLLLEILLGKECRVSLAWAEKESPQLDLSGRPIAEELSHVLTATTPDVSGGATSEFGRVVPRQ
jgi:hypothetical protein